MLRSSISAAGRPWFIVLCLAANFVVALSAAAQSPQGATAVTSELSVVQADDNAVLDPAECGGVALNLPTALRNIRLLHRFADDARGGPFGQQRVGSRDSLKNGATIGAVIGAVGFGAFAAALCHAYREEGGASCTPDALRFAAIGGAIGTGAGLAIDAARSDGRVTARLTIKFRWSFWNIAAADKVFSVRTTGRSER